MNYGNRNVFYASHSTHLMGIIVLSYGGFFKQVWGGEQDLSYRKLKGMSNNIDFWRVINLSLAQLIHLIQPN